MSSQRIVDFVWILGKGSYSARAWLSGKGCVRCGAEGKGSVDRFVLLPKP